MSEQHVPYTPGQPSQAASEAQPGVPPGAETTAFCQNCGRGLTRQTARIIGQAVFCEPCLIDRLASGQPLPPNAPPYSNPTGVNDPATAWMRVPPGTPNPGLATLLGFIPGVGAMYNGQYAKGIVHLIVFVLLVTVSDSFGIFGLFVAGWEFYMAIDANHTARARRDGLPLPNPFGLNDIGERLGFGKAWPGSPNVGAAAQQAAQQAAQAIRDAAQYANAQASSRGPGQPAPFPPPGTTASAPPNPANPYNQNWSQTYTGTTPPPYSAQPPLHTAPVMATAVSRFPAGAVWLIGLGSIFLLSTTGLFERVHPHIVFGLILVGLGGWVFVRRMAESGLSWQDAASQDQPAVYRYRIFRAARVSIWLVGIGLWFLLDSFRWIHLHQTWPLLLILAGVMALLERVFFSASQADPLPTPQPAGNGDWSPTPGTPGASPDPAANVPTGGL